MIVTEISEVSSSWSKILDLCRNTVNKKDIGKEPSSIFKKRLLMAEHSPIRTLSVQWRWPNLKSWISVHFVRHKIGIEHFVSTQRDDRTGKGRDKASQDTEVSHSAHANAHAIMAISRRRLCKQAHKETREAWVSFLGELVKHEMELVSRCVPECVYRNGLCPEMNSCGWNKGEQFKQQLLIYLEGFEGQVG